MPSFRHTRTNRGGCPTHANALALPYRGLFFLCPASSLCFWPTGLVSAKLTSHRPPTLGKHWRSPISAAFQGGPTGPHEPRWVSQRTSSAGYMAGALVPIWADIAEPAWAVAFGPTIQGTIHPSLVPPRSVIQLQDKVKNGLIGRYEQTPVNLFVVACHVANCIENGDREA